MAHRRSPGSRGQGTAPSEGDSRSTAATPITRTSLVWLGPTSKCTFHATFPEGPVGQLPGRSSKGLNWLGVTGGLHGSGSPSEREPFGYDFAVCNTVLSVCSVRFRLGPSISMHEHRAGPVSRAEISLPQLVDNCCGIFTGLALSGGRRRPHGLHDPTRETAERLR